MKEGRPSPGGRGLERMTASAVVLARKGEGLAPDVGASRVLGGATAHPEGQATPLIRPFRGHLLPPGEGKREGVSFPAREVQICLDDRRPFSRRGRRGVGVRDEGLGHHPRHNGCRNGDKPRPTESRPRPGRLQRDTGHPEPRGAGAGAGVEGG